MSITALDSKEFDLVLQSDVGSENHLMDIKLRLFIPSPVGGLGNYAADWMAGVFGGDSRNFQYEGGTSRGEIHCGVNFPLNSKIENPIMFHTQPRWGVTKKYNIDDTEPVEGKPDWWRKPKPGVRWTKKKRLRRNSDNLNVTADYIPDNNGEKQILRLKLKVDGANPLASGSPSISANLHLYLMRKNDTTYVGLHGRHDGFPAYELYVDRKLVYGFDPLQNKETPWSLFGSGEHIISRTWHSID